MGADAKSVGGALRGDQAWALRRGFLEVDAGAVNEASGRTVYAGPPRFRDHEGLMEGRAILWGVRHLSRRVENTQAPSPLSFRQPRVGTWVQPCLFAQPLQAPVVPASRGLAAQYRHRLPPRVDPIGAKSRRPSVSSLGALRAARCSGPSPWPAGGLGGRPVGSPRRSRLRGMTEPTGDRHHAWTRCCRSRGSDRAPLALRDMCRGGGGTPQLRKVVRRVLRVDASRRSRGASLPGRVRRPHATRHRLPLQHWMPTGSSGARLSGSEGLVAGCAGR